MGGRAGRAPPGRLGAAQVRDDRIEALERGRAAQRQRSRRGPRRCERPSRRPGPSGDLGLLPPGRAAVAVRSRAAHPGSVPARPRRTRRRRRDAGGPARRRRCRSGTRPTRTFRAALKRHLDRLDALRGDLGTGPTAADFQRLRDAPGAGPATGPPPIGSSASSSTTSPPWSDRAQQDQEAARARDRVAACTRPGRGDREARPTVNRRARWPARRPAGAGGGPSAAAARRRSRPASRSGRGTR